MADTGAIAVNMMKREVMEMTADTAPVLYVRLRKRVAVPKGRPVLLGDAAQLLCEPRLETELKQLVLYRPDEVDGSLVLVDMLQVVGRVTEAYPGMKIETFGDPQTLVQIQSRTGKPRPLLAAAAWLLLFMGSGLAIMNFHADVSMPQVHQRIYALVTGETVEHPLIMQIPYSFGLGLGMILFFNHLFRKKFNEEPSPLDVEMYMYQENLDQYMIMEEYKKKREQERERHG